MANKLFDTAPELPAGCWILRNFIDDLAQMACVQFCRDLLATHPLMQPKTASGYDLSLRVSSWGKVGWFGDQGRYAYIRKHENGLPWPEIPIHFRYIMNAAVAVTVYEGYCIKLPSDDFKLDTVLLNWYGSAGKLGRHQDKTEEDKESPIVTISLGDSCIFNIGTENFDDKGIDFQIDSGDVLVMAGESRMAYHGVKKILPGTSKLLKNGGRLSLTGRKVFKND